MPHANNVHERRPVLAGAKSRRFQRFLELVSQCDHTDPLQWIEYRPYGAYHDVYAGGDADVDEGLLFRDHHPLRVGARLEQPVHPFDLGEERTERYREPNAVQPGEDEARRHRTLSFALLRQRYDGRRGDDAPEQHEVEKERLRYPHEFIVTLPVDPYGADDARQHVDAEERVAHAHLPQWIRVEILLHLDGAVLSRPFGGVADAFSRPVASTVLWIAILVAVHSGESERAEFEREVLVTEQIQGRVGY